MSIFDVLALFGGLALFLFGMNVMGDGLTRAAGGKMERILEKLTSTPIKGVLLGAAVTAVIIGYNRYGCWLCKFRDYETASGGRHYHGCQYRYDSYFLDLKLVGNSGRQYLDPDVKAILIFSDPGGYRYCISDVFQE